MPGTDKARTERLSRLNATLSSRLENPAAALETLMSELKLGDPHADLWRALHEAAERDGVEVETAWAYEKITADRRLAAFSKPVAAAILMNAANFSENVLGDSAGAEVFLQRSLHLAPDQPEVYRRLAARYEAAADHLRLIDLHARVVATPPKPLKDLAHEVARSVAQVPAKTPVPDDSCRVLVALVSESPSLLEALVAHCQKTGRAKLAGELYERVLTDGLCAASSVPGLRRRLVELYLGAAAEPAKAMPHVETMLEADPADAKAREAARRLLSTPEVASRAAAVLQRTRHVETPPSKPGR